ncbi:MAG: DUF1289 domain-containing protein [Boseongicola sp.]|nr:DUF1289 domain-containing protein [Boseongicola sp.]
MTDQSDSQSVWKRDEIESPCVQICMIHPDARICIGCYRTGDEIARWSRLSPDERREVMSELPTRKDRLPKRRGGRAARQARTK